MQPDSAKPMPPTSDTQYRRTPYWRRTRRLTVQLLLAWFFVTLGTVFFARELSSMTFLGWPFSFYMAAQGTTLIYLLIVGLYAWRMRRLEKMFGNDPDHVE